jgi:hypothetical protein
MRLTNEFTHPPSVNILTGHGSRSDQNRTNQLPHKFVVCWKLVNRLDHNGNYNRNDSSLLTMMIDAAAADDDDDDVVVVVTHISLSLNASFCTLS